MRAFTPDYQLTTPSSLSEALTLLASEPNKWRAFAGGTDLMVLLEAGKLPHRNYVNIWQLDELRGIKVENDQITLGALTTYTEVQNHPVLRTEFPMLCQAASETGGLAIQNRGTLGGNIINASPAADSPPALLAYDAQLELGSSIGTRRIAYKDFHTGYKEMQIRADELLTRIHLPRATENGIHYYRKVGTRRAQAISKVCLAAFASVQNDVITEVRIAFGSVAPIPVRCVQTEKVLRGNRLDDGIPRAVLDTLTTEIAPIDDIRSTASYRMRVSGNLLLDFLSNIDNS